MNSYSKIIRPIIGPLIFLIVFTLPLELQSNSQTFLAIFSMVVYLWLEGKVPLFITGILGVSLSILFGIEKANVALSSFANPIIFLFLAGFLYAKAMEETGLDKRLSLIILEKENFSHSLKKLILVLFSITAFLSMWVSNTATTAMMLPIILGIMSSLSINDHRTQTLLLLGVAYSASIGGLGTPVGSPPNIIAIGLLKELKGIEIAFYQWALYGIPFVIIFVYLLYKYITLQINIDREIDNSFIKIELQKLGKMHSKEKVLIILFIGLVMSWFIPGILHAIFNSDFTLMVKNRFDTGAIGILFASFLFLIPFRERTTILNSKDFKSIDWGSLFLFGSGLSLGKLLFTTGLAELAGAFLIQNILGSSLFLILLAICYFTIFSTELASNTASANILIPILISACSEIGVAPKNPIIAVALCCSLAFMLPVGTPPNAIVYGTGLVSSKEMIKVGLLLNLSFGLIVSISFYFLSR